MSDSFPEPLRNVRGSIRKGLLKTFMYMIVVVLRRSSSTFSLLSVQLHMRLLSRWHCQLALKTSVNEFCLCLKTRGRACIHSAKRRLLDLNAYTLFFFSLYTLQCLKCSVQRVLVFLTYLVW